MRYMAIVLLFVLLALPACAHGGWVLKEHSGFASHHQVYVPQAPPPAAPLTLQANDRVVFAGDSITYFGAQPGGYVTQFNAFVQSKYPGQNITVQGVGYPGQGVVYLLSMMPTIIAQYQPTVLVLEIGVNDAAGIALQYETVSAFQNNYQQVILKAQHARIRELVLTSPMCIGEKRVGENVYDTQVDQIAAAIRGFGYAYSQPVIDLRTSWEQKELLYNPNNIAGGVLDDAAYGVHPNALGAQVLSQLLYQAFTQ